VRDQFPELTSVDPLDWAGPGRTFRARPRISAMAASFSSDIAGFWCVLLTFRLRYVPVFLLVPSFFLFTAFADASESAWRPFCRMQIAWLTELA